jgi:predicted GIY-YIG superfamily endonuclease
VTAAAKPGWDSVCAATPRQAALSGRQQIRGAPLKYVYILENLGDPERHYVGITNDLRARLKLHNAGRVTHTSKHAPWSLKTYLAFTDEAQAFAFERYLKSHSGRAFAKKRL